MTGPARQHIVIGLVFNQARDRLLIARRPQQVHQGGLWEFPGGKAAPGEQAQETLKRELFEELALVVQQASPFMCFDHDYPAVRLKLDVWTVQAWQGDIRAREGQALAWVRMRELKAHQFPAANRRILSVISRLYARAV